MDDRFNEFLELLKGVRVTFDPERSFTLPCIACGTTEAKRNLIDVGSFICETGGGFQKGDRLTRPMCEACREILGLGPER